MSSRTVWSQKPILLLAGCTHGEPTVAATGGLDQPFQVGAPLRLTYSDGFDGDASLSTASGRIVYAFDRERTILGLLALGQRNAEIAAATFLSPKTVSNHLTSIFAKLQVAGRGEAIVRAREGGLGTSR